MSNERITKAYEVLNSAFISQYGKTKESIDMELSALEDDNPVWDFDTNCTRYTEFKHKYPLPRGLKKTRLKPAISIMDDLLSKDDLLKYRTHCHKAQIYKASLYDSTKYDKVVVFLVSDHRTICREGRTQDNHVIDNRVDVIFDNGEIKLGNTQQMMCAACGGASALPGQECTGGAFLGKCEHSGFLNPPINDIGIIGAPIAIVRYSEPSSKYLGIYNAEC